MKLQCKILYYYFRDNIASKLAKENLRDHGLVLNSSIDLFDYK